MPKPMNIVVSASPDGGARPPRPGEERIAVYASVAAGAHGICYYWYNANKEAGCQWVADTWAEIAILNRQLQLLAPQHPTLLRFPTRCFISLASAAKKHPTVLRDGMHSPRCNC